MRLLVINDFGMQGGGTENRVRLLLNEFLRRGNFGKIHLLQLSNNKNAFKNNVISCHYSSGGIRDTYKITRDIIKNEGINIIQAHNMLALTPSSVRAAKDLKVPVAWFAHDYWPLCAFRSFINPYNSRKMSLCEQAKFSKCVRCVGLRSTLRLKLFQWLVNKVDVAISPGNFVKDLYESHNVLKGKWRIVKPWIALDIFGNIKQSEIANQIIFVGPLVDYKGAWVVAESLKYILKVVPDVKLKFIGDNQEKDGILRKKIEEIGLRDSTLNNMVFVGYKDWEGLKEEYAQGGIGVCTSVCKELFGLHWSEAMAAGCPVVASSIGSLPEFIKDNGLLVPPGAPENLAETVIMLLKDKEYAKALGQRGRRYALETFNVKRAADELIDIYTELLKRG